MRDAIRWFKCKLKPPKNGKTFWSPVHEIVTINGFSRWEQAFHIYSNIYTKAHPHRSSELIQYNHIIHTISLTYVWENVYNYDKEFRLHLSRYPGRSWSVILQQAWSMRLKDRLTFTKGESNHGNYAASGFNSHGNNNGNGNSKAKNNEPCRRFNKGKCKFGANCRYEHRCSYCLKFGHAILTCRKLIADMDKGQVKQNSSKDHSA